jgi:hypothetical protein
MDANILGEASNFFFWVANHFSTQTRVAMWIIFSSGRNVYVIREPS